MLRFPPISGLLALGGFVFGFAVANNRLFFSGQWCGLFEVLPLPARFDGYPELTKFAIANVSAAVVGAVVLAATSRRWRHLYLLILPVMAGAMYLFGLAWHFAGEYVLGTGRTLDLLGFTYLTLFLGCCIGILGCGTQGAVTRPLFRRFVGGFTVLLVLLVVSVGGFLVLRDMNNPKLQVLSAADAQDWRTIRRLVSAEPSLSRAQDQFKESLLHVAATHGNRETAEFLLTKGADIDAAMYNGKAPLHVACRLRQTEMVKLLLDHGADVNRNARFYGTPLLTAARYGNIETVRLLLAAGAKTDITNENGTSPLHWAVVAGNPKIVELLLANGANVNAKDNFFGQTPLYDAENPAMAELLLGHGAELDAKDRDGRTPFFEAVCWVGRLNVAALLLARGADVNVRDKLSGETALHSAAMLGNFRAVQLLLEAGADANATDAMGATPLYRAGHVGVIRLLTHAGGKVNRTGEYCGAPLAVAAQRGDLEAVRELLAQGADVNGKDAQGYTALHAVALSSSENKEAAAELLIRAGADINARTQQGETPLTVALHCHTPDVAAVLRRHGAKQ